MHQHWMYICFACKNNKLLQLFVNSKTCIHVDKQKVLFIALFNGCNYVINIWGFFSGFSHLCIMFLNVWNLAE